MKKQLFLIGGLLCVALVVYVVGTSLSCRNFKEDSIITPSGVLGVAIAKTPEQQAKGLSGCKKIPANSGMYFPFSAPTNAVFWMKDMLIPIDIVWIKDGVVVGIEGGAQIQIGASDSALKRYPAPGPVDAVLEIQAGKSNEYGLVIGSEIREGLINIGSTSKRNTLT